MFVDYITLLLVNTTIGLFAAAFFLAKGIEGGNPRPWAAVFAASGAVLFVAGIHMAVTWPVTVAKLRFANMAFGETSVLFGALLLGLALSLAKGWDLRPMTIYAFFVGLAAIVLGISVAANGLTAQPALTAAGYILAGAGAVLTPVALGPGGKPFRAISALLLVLAGLVWALTTSMSYWKHMEMMSK